MTTEQEKQVIEHMRAIAAIFKVEHKSNPKSLDNCILIAKTGDNIAMMSEGSPMTMARTLAHIRANDETFKEAVSMSDLALAIKMW